MNLSALSFSCMVFLIPVQASGQEPVDHTDHGSHQMRVEKGGVVMNENLSTLPRDCAAISIDHNVTIHAGRKYADVAAGTMYGMSQYEVRAQPCSRITVTFVNEDKVRHQWMVHGLPKYLYPAGMFHIEASGGHSKTGTFIVPGDDQTYLIHCDMSQHMEKGMRGQLVVGGGSGDLWGVTGISGQFFRSYYLPGHAPVLAFIIFIFSFLLWLRLFKKS